MGHRVSSETASRRPSPLLDRLPMVIDDDARSPRTIAPPGPRAPRPGESAARAGQTAGACAPQPPPPAFLRATAPSDPTASTATPPSGPSPSSQRVRTESLTACAGQHRLHFDRVVTEGWTRQGDLWDTRGAHRAGPGQFERARDATRERLEPVAAAGWSLPRWRRWMLFVLLGGFVLAMISI